MPNSTKPGHQHHDVKKSQLKQLVDNYYEVIKKKDINGDVVNLDRSKDAKSVWFSKAVIDKLFADHGCNSENNDDFGLRMYFAVHKEGVLDNIKPSYQNQQTIILVPTKKELGFEDHDLIKNDEELLMATDGKGDPTDPTGGTGGNHSKLCPPDTDCGCAI